MSPGPGQDFWGEDRSWCCANTPALGALQPQGAAGITRGRTDAAWPGQEHEAGSTVPAHTVPGSAALLGRTRVPGHRSTQPQTQQHPEHQHTVPPKAPKATALPAPCPVHSHGWAPVPCPRPPPPISQAPQTLRDTRARAKTLQLPPLQGRGNKDMAPKRARRRLAPAPRPLPGCRHSCQSQRRRLLSIQRKKSSL